MDSLLQISWNVSPILVQFTETFALRWYGILFSLAYLISYYILVKGFEKEGKSIEILEKITLAAIIGGIVGARLGHCMFYEPLRYIHNPIKILYIWEGGLASHGGGIGILLTFWFISRKYALSFITILSRAMLCVPLGGALIRIGNLFNSEIYGYPTNAPWGFIFNNSIDVQAGIEEAIPRHPTQIYEAILYLLVFIILQWYYWKQIKNKAAISDYFIVGVFLIGIFLSRFVIEFFKQNQVSFENDMVLNMGQILSLPFILFGIYALYKHFKQNQEI